MTADSLANKKLVVNNVKVNPQVPLFITYYTLYPLAGGRIADYSDVYGFDAVIFDMFRGYLINNTFVKAMINDKEVWR